MDTNEFEGNAETFLRRVAPNSNGARLNQGAPSPPSFDKLKEEFGHLQLEVERLREVQQALQRMPPANQPQDDIYEDDLNDSAPPRPGRTRRFSRSPLRVLLVVVGAILLALAGHHLSNYLQSYEWTDDAEIDGHLDPISTRLNGTVVHVYVENTYHVKKGQPLVDLDPRDYQVALENATANFAQTQQAAKAAQQNYALSVANLAAGNATNAKAQADVRRYRELFEQNVIAREAYDEIVRVGKVDAAAVNSDRAAVAAAARMIGQAEAATQAAQASLNQARLNLSYTHIVAPTNGVGDKTVQVGQRVQPGEQLLTVVPLNDIWITADFRETQLRRMHRGQPVTVHVDTTGRDYQGYIEGMPGATGELFSLLPPENATGNYVKVVQRLPVRILLNPGEDPHHRLRPGMSVEPTVWLDGGPRTLW